MNEDDGSANRIANLKGLKLISNQKEIFYTFENSIAFALCGQQRADTFLSGVANVQLEIFDIEHIKYLDDIPYIWGIYRNITAIYTG